MQQIYYHFIKLILKTQTANSNLKYTLIIDLKKISIVVRRLIFISAGIYIATWIMYIGLAYKRNQYILVAIFILTGAILIFWQIF